VGGVLEKRRNTAEVMGMQQRKSIDKGETDKKGPTGRVVLYRVPPKFKEPSTLGGCLS